MSRVVSGPSHCHSGSTWGSLGFPECLVALTNHEHVTSLKDGKFHYVNGNPEYSQILILEKRFWWIFQSNYYSNLGKTIIVTLLLLGQSMHLNVQILQALLNSLASRKERKASIVYAWILFFPLFNIATSLYVKSVWKKIEVILCRPTFSFLFCNLKLAISLFILPEFYFVP